MTLIERIEHARVQAYKGRTADLVDVLNDLGLEEHVPRDGDATELLAILDVAISVLDHAGRLG